jgi:TRAP-type C4-dicarboxylate transport system permease large subunit
MAGLTRTPIGAIAKQALPFVLALIVVSAIIGFFPSISLFTLK